MTVREAQGRYFLRQATEANCHGITAITYVATSATTQTQLPNNSVDVVDSLAELRHVSDAVIVGFPRAARQIP